MLRRSLSCVFLGCFALTLYSHAWAQSVSGKQITYVFEGIASGYFQPASGPATSFSGESFTITAVADPANVVESTQYCKVPSGTCKLLTVPVDSARISVAGVTATFTRPLAIFVNQTYKALGLQRAKAADVLDLQSEPAFATYDLKSDLAPFKLFMQNVIMVGQFKFVETSLGALTVESVQNVSFIATVNF